MKAFMKNIKVKMMENAYMYIILYLYKIVFNQAVATIIELTKLVY